MMDIIAVNQAAYNVIRLLGNGKGGYSYLVEKDGLYIRQQNLRADPKIRPEGFMILTDARSIRIYCLVILIPSNSFLPHTQVDYYHF